MPNLTVRIDTVDTDGDPWNDSDPQLAPLTPLAPTLNTINTMRTDFLRIIAAAGLFLGASTVFASVVGALDQSSGKQNLTCTGGSEALARQMDEK